MIMALPDNLREKFEDLMEIYSQADEEIHKAWDTIKNLEEEKRVLEDKMKKLKEMLLKHIDEIMND